MAWFALWLALTALVAALAAPATEAAPANFAGASADGSKVFFTTSEKLVPGDTDRGFEDVYERTFDPESGIETYVTRELSTGPAGGNDAYPASYVGASTTGEEVFFTTQEPLISADHDRAVDVYMRNTTTGATTLVSRGASSCEGTGCGNGPAAASFKSVTPDGSRVFFQTTESLVPEDADGASDVYVRNLEAEPPVTELVSRSAGSCVSGGCGNGAEGATFVGASANGKRVFFKTAESLVPADTDSSSDIYLRNLETEPPTTTLITTEGTCPEGASVSECIPTFRAVSADGSRVFFTSSEKLSSEDLDGKGSDVYVWEEGAISLVSTGPTAANADKPATFAGSRANGSLVFFQTEESLTPADTDGVTDVYLRDLEAEPPTTTLVSAGDPSCVEAGSCGAGPSSTTFAGASASGETVFLQTAEKLSPADGNSSSDVYARNTSAGTTTLVSAAAAGCEGEACGPPAPAIFAGASANGSVAFFTTEESLVPEDGEAEDVYRRDLGSSTTTLESAPGICPLPGESGCDATFAGASEDGVHLFFGTVRRLTARDGDSEADLYEREGPRTRLVSDSNSVTLGPATPVLTELLPGPTGESVNPSVKGHGPAGAAIKIYKTSDCSGEAVAGTVEELEGGGIQVTVPPGTTTSITATATDVTNTTSDCSNVLNYTQRAAPPSVEEGGGGGGGSGSGGGSASGEAGGPGSTGSSSSAGSGGSAGFGGSGGINYVQPLTRITFGPAFKTRARHPEFRFVDATGQPGTRFFCRLDRQHWKGCSSPIRLNHLRFGRHTFRVKAVNAVGEWQAKPTARTFKLVGAGG